MKRNIQSYFMSSKECCHLCQKKNDPHKLIAKNLNQKYLTGMDYYNVKVVNDVIYNDTTHLVSVFKDYLIYDDISEFLKRYYNQTEAITRLTKIYDFYDKYSKVFPNYIILEENKFMFKNIERKQIAIDERQQFFQDLEEKQKTRKLKKDDSNISQLFDSDSNNMFDTNFYDSVANIKTNSQVSDHFPFEVASSVLDSHIQNCNILDDQRFKDSEEKVVKPKPKIPVRRLEDYDLNELVEKFLVKDSNILDASSIIIPAKENKPIHKPMPAPKIVLDKTKYQTIQNTNKKNVFNYQEMKAKYINDVVQIPRQDKAKHQPVTQNFMPTHRKNVYSNDGRTKHHDKYKFDNKQIDLKAQYNEIRKQKRPKSSDTQAAHQHKKPVTNKPIQFATIDNRKPNAFISQKYLYDSQRTPSDMMKSPSISPGK